MQLNKNSIIIVSFVFFFHLYPTAIKETIISSKPGQLIYLLGQRHENSTPTTQEQFKTLMEILEKAEGKEEPEFHFLIEQAKGRFEHKRAVNAGDMNTCLLPEAKKRNFKKSIFEDVEVRYLSSIAHVLLERAGECPWMGDQQYGGLIDRYNMGPVATFPAKPRTEEDYLQALHASTVSLETKRKFVQGILEMVEREKNNQKEPEIMTAEGWEELEQAVTFTKGSDRYTIDKLTFKDVIDECGSQISDLENYMQTLPAVEKQEFSHNLEGLQNDWALKRSFQIFQKVMESYGIRNDSSILEFSKKSNEHQRENVLRNLRAVKVTIMDLNLYRKIQELRKTSVKKIVVIGGGSHTDFLESFLRHVGLDKYKIFVDRDEAAPHYDNEMSLKIEYLQLLEPPVGELQNTLFIYSSRCEIQ